MVGRIYVSMCVRMHCNCRMVWYGMAYVRVCVEPLDSWGFLSAGLAAHFSTLANGNWWMSLWTHRLVPAMVELLIKLCPYCSVKSQCTPQL